MTPSQTFRKCWYLLLSACVPESKYVLKSESKDASKMENKDA